MLAAPRDASPAASSTSATADENYRKLDLIELIRERLPEADVRFVHRDEDPRDYRVSFERIRSELGFDPLMRVPDGIAEVLRGTRRGALRGPVRPPLLQYLGTGGRRRDSRRSGSGTSGVRAIVVAATSRRSASG